METDSLFSWAGNQRRSVSGRDASFGGADTDCQALCQEYESLREERVKWQRWLPMKGRRG